MLEAKCKADVVRGLIDATTPLVDEAKLKVTKEGLSLRAVDPARVAMIDLTLGKGAFSSYKAEDCELGIDLDKLRDLMKLASAEDEITFEVDEEGSRLVVRIGNLVRRMHVLDTSAMTDPQMPKLEFHATVAIAAGEIERGVRASEAVTDHLALVVTAEHFELEAAGDTDVVNLRLDKKQLTNLRCSEKEVKSLFSLDYFSNMVKAAKGASDVTLSLRTNYPVRMEFDIAGGNGRVTYLLAPRIESE